MAKQRGRPKKAETTEREKTEIWLKNLPAHYHMSTEEREKTQELLDGLEQQQKIMLSQHLQTISNELIYAYESVGHRELFEETPELLAEEAKVVEKYNVIVEATKHGQKEGGVTTAQKAFQRAKPFWDKNPDFFEAMGRPRNANTTAQRIIDNWANRGDGGKVPSINTIKNWYKLIKNSKGLSRRK